MGTIHMKSGVCVKMVTISLYALHKAQEGAVAIIFAFFLTFVMIPVLALSIDMGGGYLMSSEMQNAATSSSIASALKDGDVGEAEDYFTANLPVGLHSIQYDFASDVQVVKTGSTVSVIPTSFERPGFFSPAIQPVGTAIIRASSLSTAGLPQGALVPSSLLLVLDRSGSMTAPDAGPCPTTGDNPCTRIQALREATQKLVANIASLPEATQNYSIAGVPWSSNIYNQFPYSNDFTDVADKFNAYLTAGGNTCAQCGLNKAVEYLPISPQNKKIVVFMTDGDANKLDNNITIPSGYPADWNGGNLPAPHRGAIWKCWEIKSDPDVSLWSISFGGSAILPGTATYKMLSYCASIPDQYVHAPDGTALDAIFGQVLNQISSVRLLN